MENEGSQIFNTLKNPNAKTYDFTLIFLVFFLAIVFSFILGSYSQSKKGKELENLL